MAGKRKNITYTVTDRGCHECTSHHLNKDGYPCIFKDGRNQNMHRVLYEEKFGSLPKGHVARHTCDNPQCINMDHIVPGTPKQNSQDMVDRGRTNTPKRDGKRRDVKLTYSQIDEIRRNPNKLSQAKLGKIYGVHQGTISKIINFKKGN